MPSQRFRPEDRKTNRLRKTKKRGIKTKMLKAARNRKIPACMPSSIDRKAAKISTTKRGESQYNTLNAFFHLGTLIPER